MDLSHENTSFTSLSGSLVGDTDAAVVGNAHGVGGVGVDELVLPNLSCQPVH